MVSIQAIYYWVGSLSSEVLWVRIEQPCTVNSEITIARVKSQKKNTTDLSNPLSCPEHEALVTGRKPLLACSWVLSNS